MSAPTCVTILLAQNTHLVIYSRETIIATFAQSKTKVLKTVCFFPRFRLHLSFGWAEQRIGVETSRREMRFDSHPQKGNFSQITVGFVWKHCCCYCCYCFFLSIILLIFLSGRRILSRYRPTLWCRYQNSVIVFCIYSFRLFHLYGL